MWQPGGCSLGSPSREADVRPTGADSFQLRPRWGPCSVRSPAAPGQGQGLTKYQSRSFLPHSGVFQQVVFALELLFWSCPAARGASYPNLLLSPLLFPVSYLHHGPRFSKPIPTPSLAPTRHSELDKERH